MFTIRYRAQVRERLVQIARDDPRISAAALVGGSAEGEGDQWSDIDLAFGVAGHAEMGDVIADWTHRLRSEFHAASLFDLPFRSTLYRVFLFPGALQVDVSFTPDADFGALGPRFALMFGRAVSREQPASVSPRQHFGLAAHHVVRSYYCIERGRVWQSEYWIGQARRHALELACLRMGLPAGEGRGLDSLPPDIRAAAAETLVRSIEREELLGALRATTQLLLGEASGVHEAEHEVSDQLRELIATSSL